MTSPHHTTSLWILAILGGILVEIISWLSEKVCDLEAKLTTTSLTLQAFIVALNDKTFVDDKFRNPAPLPESTENKE